MSGGHRQLTLDKFFYCYKPQQIAYLKGFYNFVMRKAILKLVTNVPDSNRDWKGRNFFVQGTDWVCRPEEWVDVIKFDNTLGVLDTAGESSIE